MSKLNICMVSTGSTTDYIPYSHLGIQRYVVGLSKALVKAGNSVHIFARKFPFLGTYQKYEGIDIHRVNTYSMNEKISQSLFACKIISKIQKLHRNHGFDIIHVHSRVPGVGCVYLKNMINTPLIYSEHYWEIFLTRPGDIYDSLTYQMLSLCEKVTIKGSDRIFAVSEAIKHAIIRRISVSPRKIAVVSNAIDPETLNPDVDSAPAKRKYNLQGRKVILFVGRITPEKGVECLLRAMPNIAKPVPKVVLVIVGSGSHLEACRRLLTELSISKNVIFTGKIDDNDLRGLYSACDVFVLPSFGEVMPTVVLEAMAFAKPVVATNVSGTPEAVIHGRTGILVRPGRDEDLAKAIVEILKDENLASRLGIMGRMLVEEKFSWASVVSKCLSEYANTLEWANA